MRERGVAIGVMLVGALSVAGEAMAQEYRYAVIRLQSLNESLASDRVGGLNARGDVVGGAPIESIWLPRAVVWPTAGSIVELGTLGGDLASSSAVNDVGDIVGSSGLEPGGSLFVGHAFVWRNGEMIDLGTLGGETSGARAINSSGQIVGDSEFEFGNFAERGFLWENGRMVSLPGALPETFARQASDINELGEAVGSGSGLDFQYNGLLWRDGEVIDLGSLAGQGSSAYGINDLGQIVGRSEASNGNGHAVVWIDRQIIDIHDPRYGLYSWGQDVNNHGQVIGAIGDLLATRHMFIREAGQPMLLLKDLVPPRAPLPLRFDRGNINDAGQISVSANVVRTIDYFALLLTPVNPTLALAGPSPGTVGTSNTITVTNVTPGASVTFLYSRNGGGTRIPGCDLQQNALQLESPKIIGTAIADQNGTASITRSVPLVARGQTVLFQAVVQSECAISQLVVHEFE